MVDATQPASDVSTEKAYAEATKTVGIEAEQVAPEPVVEATAAPEAESVEPVITPAKVVRAKAKPAKAKPVAKRDVKRKPAATKTAKAPVSPKPSKPEVTRMNKSPEFVEGIRKVVADTQAKARQAYGKGQAVLGEYADFAKGNVQAVVESGKVLANGLHDMGNDFIAEGRTTIETMAADTRELASVKSPGAFFKLHSEILARNLDHAVELGSKNSQAVLKLGKAVVAPLSGRVSLAVEKLRKAA